MAVTKPRPLTKFDYWQLPETGPRYQLINGDLYTAPAPNRLHQDISRTIEFEILKYLEREPRGIIYDAPFDVILTDLNVFQPDLDVTLRQNDLLRSRFFPGFELSVSTVFQRF